MKTLPRLAAAAALLSVTGCGWINDFTRSQARADAQNDVAIRDIQIQTEHQQVEIVRQQALQRIEEAKGIAEAQKIVNRSLTPLYIQHEAIQAQLEAAKNSSHTETIYIPSGTQGLPLVHATN